MAATTACGVDETQSAEPTVEVETLLLSAVSSKEIPVDEFIPELPHNTSEGISKWMKPEIYRAASKGEREFFEQLADDPESSISDQVSPRGRTILHIAAAAGAEELVTSILRRCPNLLTEADHAGDSALHVAASAGHFAATEELIGFAKERQPEVSWFSYFLQRNRRTGNTALHAALGIGRGRGSDEVARLLVKECPSELGLNCINEAGESPLYLAAMAGNLEMVKLLLEKAVIEHEVAGKSVVHAAIKSRNTDMVDAILSKWPRLFESFDEEGRTPLSFAAQAGNLDAVLYILKKFPDSAYRRDRNDEDFFPIHAAASGGHKKIVGEILRGCPDAWELLTYKKKQNFLHVAARMGKSGMVKYVLERSEDEIDMLKLVNEGDGTGDTPLHLATVYWHPMVVSTLTWDTRVQLGAVNDSGLTPLDVARKQLCKVPPFRQILTLAALYSAGVPRSDRLIKARETTVPHIPNQERPSCEPYKERVSTLLLVATLVATVTFTCGFTMPGGNDTNSGAATLLSKHMFHAFFICNAIAMNSSIVAVVVLIAAQLEDTGLTRTALEVAVPLIGISLGTMLFAFTAGVYLVVRHLRWLAIFILVVGPVFASVLVALYLQLCSRLQPRNRLLRYLFYHSFCFFVWASGSNKDASKE